MWLFQGNFQKNLAKNLTSLQKKHNWNWPWRWSAWPVPKNTEIGLEPNGVMSCSLISPSFSISKWERGICRPPGECYTEKYNETLFKSDILVHNFKKWWTWTLFFALWNDNESYPICYTVKYSRHSSYVECNDISIRSLRSFDKFSIQI